MNQRIVESSPEVFVELDKDKPIRVLHVDDESALLTVAKQCLEMQGPFQVDAVNSVEEAFERLRKETYDAVVSDYQMPGKDGLEFLKELRQSGSTVPFLIFTGKGREEVAIQALNLGANQYINKTGDPGTVYCELAHGIQQAVQRNKAEERIRQSEEKSKDLLEFQSKVIDTAIVWIDLLDKEGNVTLWNRAAELISGYSRDEVVGHKKIWEWLYPDPEYCAEIFAHQRRAIEHRESAFQNFETLIRCKNGALKTISWHSNNILGEEGEPVGSIAVGLDITETKRIEKELFESNAKLQNILAASPDSITVTDMDGNIVECNQATLDLFGYTQKEELIGKNALTLFVKKDHPTVMENHRNALNQGPAKNLEYTMLTRDNHEFLAEVSTSVIKDHSGKPRGFVGISKDITLRKKMEKELKENEERLKAIVINAPIGIATSGADKHFLSANDTFCRILGYTEDELRKLTFKDVTHPEDIKESITNIEDLSAGRISHFDQEKRYIKKDGNVIIGRVMVSALRDQDCKPRIFIVELEDITERRKKEEALKESEEKLRGIIDNSTDFIFLLDRDSKILSINKAAADARGKSPQELVGMSAFATFPETTAAQFSENIKNVFDTGKSMFIDEKMFVNGRELYNSTNLNPVRDNRGRVIAVAGIVRDITERKKTEEELRRKRAEFEVMFMKNPEASVYCDADYQVLDINPRFQEFFGYSIDEAKGKNLDDLVVPQVKIEECEARWRDAKKEPIYFDTVMRRKDGTLVPVSLSAAPLTVEDKISGYVILYKDISERVSLENKLREYSEHLNDIVNLRTEQLEESEKRLLKAERLAAIGQLAGMVGHDLRNPLQAIQNATFYVKTEFEGSSRNDNHAPNIKKAIEAIEKSLFYSNKIINDLLDYSREIRLELDQVAPKTIIQEAISTTKTPEGILVKNCVEDTLRMELDPAKMQRVFSNLVKNAFDAMPEGGELEISSNTVDHHVDFVFTDTGTGMSQETMNRIWTPLFTTKSRGMGFGLPICKRYVEAHGGQILVTSKIGEGTTFRVRLPIKHPAEQRENSTGNQ